MVFIPKSRVLVLEQGCRTRAPGQGMQEAGGAVGLSVHLHLGTDLLAKAGKLLDSQFACTWGIHTHEGHLRGRKVN